MKEFEDSLNTAVFTSTFVMRHKKEITHVTHDVEDGAWQFHSNDNWTDYEEVAMIVCLEEIIKVDKSVLEIADLPMGYQADRKSSKDKWIISKQRERQDEA